MWSELPQIPGNGPEMLSRHVSPRDRTARKDQEQVIWPHPQSCCPSRQTTLQITGLVFKTC